MISSDVFQQQLLDAGQPAWAAEIPNQLQQLDARLKNGRIDEWQQLLAGIKNFTASDIKLDQDTIEFSPSDPLDNYEKQQLQKLLFGFQPWRKGPFKILDIHIDTEWRSDWKWERLRKFDIELTDRRILDVGCGNGYHCLRAIGAGAKSVVGIDPTLLYVAQFTVLNHFANQKNACVLPFALEDLSEEVKPFDTIFSMGVLYHRRSPMDHLLKLRQLLKTDGELVLETLVMTDRELLVPEGRYAQMRNVWFIPSVEQLTKWLTRCGFSTCEVIDISATTTTEQRRTEWMTYDSLEQFLDPEDQSKTIEGYPAPVRAAIKATV